MAQLVSLAQMRNTVRRMTARYTPQQMTDSQIDNYINLAYTLHFPEQFKNIKLTKPFTLLTVPNVDTYDFIYEENPTNPITGGQTIASPGAIQLTPPFYCQGYLLRYYQDKTTFYNRWPKLSVNQQIGTGSSTPSTLYTGTIPSTPFLRAQLDIFGNVTEASVIISVISNNPGDSVNGGFNVSFTDIPQPDSNVGDLVDINNTVVGTINYLTGEYSFTASLISDSTIYASVVPYQASRPVEVLFYNQQLIFRPVPLQVFQIEFQISQQPTQLIMDNAAPELDEWYLFICAIASKLIYTDFPDPEGEASLEPKYQEQLQIAQRRTLRQLGSQRVQTIFSQPGRPFSSWFFGTEYSGGY